MSYVVGINRTWLALWITGTASVHTALERFDCRHLFGKKIYIVLVNSGTLHAQYHFKKGDSHSRLDPRDLNPWDPILASRNSNILRIETGESSFEEWVETINLCLSSTVSQLFLLLISQRLTNAWVSFICCSVSPPHWLGMHISSQNGFRG